MKFYCIASTKRKKHAELIKEACDQHGLEFVLINPESFNFDTSCEENSILYRASNYRDHLAREVEIFMVNSSTTTFYSSYDKTKFSYPNGIIEYAMHSQNNIAIPNSIVYNGQTIEELERLIVGKLKHFPIVLKISGLSEGVGVVQIDSIESLASVLDIVKNNEQIIILKEMVKIARPVFSYRGIVIDKKVVFCYKNQSVTTKDFRSNADQSQRQRTRVELADKDQEIIVNAVSVLGIELGAVDFVYDELGQIKIFEVNYPFNFLPIVEDLKYPIHEKLVNYLVTKAKK